MKITNLNQFDTSIPAKKSLANKICKLLGGESEYFKGDYSPEFISEFKEKLSEIITEEESKLELAYMILNEDLDINQFADLYSMILAYYLV